MEFSIVEGRRSCLPTAKNMGIVTYHRRSSHNSIAAGETAAPTYESPLITEAKPVVQFRFRILLVDDEPLIRETAK